MNNEYKNRIYQKLKRELGPLVLEQLENDKIIEIMLNSDGQLWSETYGSTMTKIGEMTHSSAHALMTTIASTLNTSITADNPILEGELPIDGSRFEGLIPPVVSRPVFTIRKKATRIISIEEYVNEMMMTAHQKHMIISAVKKRKNMLVVGGTGSGKTTLTNAIIKTISEYAPDHRIIIIEDTAEIQCESTNAVILRSTDKISMDRLLKATMRLRPDRILVGEVRGGEALALLKAWNTGHAGGIATIHANHAQAGLMRLEQLIGEVSQYPMQGLISEAIDVIIVIEKTREGRRVTEIKEVIGYKDNTYQLIDKQI